ncbi:MAG: terminase large subunit [Spirochaetes bacterium]|nr:terminase large subunit [Spirochaetota bacterium]
MKRYFAYAYDIESGKILACDAIKKMIFRFRADLAVSKKRGARWKFDETAADQIIEFSEALIQFEEPFNGQYIHLESWECFILAQLYGWVIKKSGFRRFKKALFFMGRKQGKTLIASAIALYEILTKDGIEAYSLATKQEIANKTLRNLKAFISNSEDLVELLKVYTFSILNPVNFSCFKPLSRDALLDGLNPSVAIIDELAAQRDSSAYTALTSGMGTRSEALTVIISTAGYGQSNPLVEEYEYGKKILDGTIEDDAYLVAIYEYDTADRWDDLSMLRKSCPNLGISVPLSYYEEQLRQARVIPKLAGEYKVKYCNFWQAAVDAWIPDSLWTRCRQGVKKYHAEITAEALAQAPSVISIDLSSIWDWTAATRYFWVESLRKYRALHRFYIPGNLVESKVHQENPALRKWIEEGLVVATPGESIDHGYLYRDVDAWLGSGHVIAITYDPAKSKELEANLSMKATIVPFPQKNVYLSPAAKAWEKAIVDGSILDESPVMRWMLSCAINKSNPDSGSYFITKNPIAKARKRIDGVISSIMGFSVLQAQIMELSKPRPKMLDLSKISY